jgi:serine protease Do
MTGKEKNRMWYKTKRILLTAAIAVAVGSIFTIPLFVLEPSDNAVYAADKSEALQTLKDFGDTFAQVAESASPAVVSIQVTREIASGQMSLEDIPEIFPDDLLEFFFGPRGRGFGRQFPQPRDRVPRDRERYRQRVPMGQGSGFIIDRDGYIVTNNHVVGQVENGTITVKLSDGREFEAELVGNDPKTDVALIKVDASDLPSLSLGDSDQIKVGEWVLAIGNPFGLTHTVTAGIVSARGRGNVGIVDYADFIQTDAAINPGNSGGPLINLDGEVVGMNTAIYSRTGGSMGIGFAIPINMITYVEKQLRETGTVTRGQLGVVIQPLTRELADSFGVDEGTGILIGQVMEDSAADKAGLKRGDVIIEYNDQPVGDLNSFRSRVASTAPGSKMNLVILRDGKRLDKTVTIGTLDEEQMAAAAPQGPGGPAKIEKDIGVTVQNLTDDVAAELGYEEEEGVVVTSVEPGSPAALAGIESGNLIQEVNRKKVQNIDQFEEALDKARGKETVLLLVSDGQYSRYVALRIRE